MNKKKIWEFIQRYLVIEILIFAAILILDQISKWQITVHFPQEGQGVNDVIPYLFNIVYVRNTGAAFGLLDNARWFFIVITVIAVLAFGFALVKFRRFGKLFRISVVLIIAGALGNLIDRMFLGFVRDFIQFAFWSSFPVFNVADISLVVGVVMLAVWLIFFYKEKEKTPGPAAASAPEQPAESAGSHDAESAAEQGAPSNGGKGEDEHGTV